MSKVQSLFQNACKNIDIFDLEIIIASIWQNYNKDIDYWGSADFASCL